MNDLDEGLRVEPENESLQKEKVKLLEEWEEVKGEMFVAQATQDRKNPTAPSQDVISAAEVPAQSELTKAEVKKHPNNAGINANINATKDDEKKEESSESNFPGDGVPPSAPASAPPSRPQAKSLPKRPKEFGLIDTFMEKLNTSSPNAIRTALNALADVLKDDEKFRIYFRSSGHFEKLIEIFLLEDASLWLIHAENLTLHY